MNDYRIERPSTDVDLAWLVIEPMWKAVDIYQDESTLEQTLAGATPGQSRDQRISQLEQLDRSVLG